MSVPSTWAIEILNSNAVILDTETTGGAKTDQIIQLSIIDMRGKVLFDSLLCATCEINPMAAQVHHLTKHHLRNAPSFKSVHDSVKNVLDGRTVIAYNHSFDKRMLQQTVKIFGFDDRWVEGLDWQCAMRAYATYLGVKNAPKLEGGDHSSLGDCLATLKLIRDMAGSEAKKEEPEVEQKPMNGNEIIAYFMPPIEVINHLSAVYGINRSKGAPVPESCTRWLQNMQDVRSDGKTPIDGTTAKEWAEVERVMDRAKVRA